MNEIDILKSIADNLSERKSTAALNNYEVLCNNWIIRSKLTPSPVKIRKDFPFNWKILNAIPADVDPLYCLKRK